MLFGTKTQVNTKIKGVTDQSVTQNFPLVSRYGP